MASSPRIQFGIGKIDLLPELIASYGSKVLIVSGARSFSESTHWNRLQHALRSTDIKIYRYLIPGEPSPEMIDKCVRQFQEKGIPLVVAIGGGSVMDAGKAISAMLTCTHPIDTYLEGVGELSAPGTKIPFIAVPTTAGTGSEATKNAVISKVGIGGYKKSLRHENYVPDLALVDPQLALGTPAAITIASGMDAFTQLLESYLSTQSNQLTDSLAIEGMRCIRDGLPQAVTTPYDIEARSCIAYAALVSGITLANVGLGLVHGFASSVGGRFAIPHGALCGTLMGITNQITLQKALATQREAIVEKYATVGRLFFPDLTQDEEAARALIAHISGWVEEFDLPLISNYGIDHSHLPEIVSQTSLKNHPIELSQKEMETILEARL